MKIEELLALLKGVRNTGTNQWMAQCPAHSDEVASLSIRTDGTKILLKCQAGCRTEDVLKSLGLSMRDLFDNESPAQSQGKTQEKYDYIDERGDLLFQVVRTKPKGFFQRRPDGQGGWINNLKGTRRVLYRLPELLASDSTSTVYVVEGEKDADQLRSLGLISTTNPGGAGKWREEYSEFLRDRLVAIVPDNDEAGRAHAEVVLNALKGIAKTVTRVKLPGPDKSDVSDWLSTHSTDDLEKLVSFDAEQQSQTEAYRSEYTAAELMTLSLPEPRWIVPKILCEGVSLLIGAAKLGKSWLALDLALGVATGTPVLGVAGTQAGRVLLLDLEGNRRRMRQRLAALLGGRAAPDNLHIMFEWPSLHDGGLERIRGFLDEHPDTCLAIIDTLACVRAGNRSTRSVYDLDYSDLTGLHSLASVRDGLAFVVVHHTRKNRRESAGDSVEEINGTMGLSASADALIYMTKGKASDRFDVKLSVKGRDVPECSLALKQDTNSPRWTVLGDAREYSISEEQHRILEFLREESEPKSPKDIAEATELSHDVVRHLVLKMAQDDLIDRCSKGLYTVHFTHSFTNESDNSEIPSCTDAMQTTTALAQSSEQSERSTPPIQAEEIALARSAIHEGQSSTRVLSEDYEAIGVAGELAFSRAFDLPIDDTARIGGDQGIDFTLPNGITIDVKTARHPAYLLREEGKDEADVLVLACFDNATGDASLIGWEWDSELLTCSTRDFGRGIVSHYKPADSLRPIEELHAVGDILGTSESEV
ncbi:AAA family ATPase [Candidatus Bipolaricaulota bacterium]